MTYPARDINDGLNETYSPSFMEEDMNYDVFSGLSLFIHTWRMSLLRLLCTMTEVLV